MSRLLEPVGLLQSHPGVLHAAELDASSLSESRRRSRTTVFPLVLLWLGLAAYLFSLLGIVTISEKLSKTPNLSRGHLSLDRFSEGRAFDTLVQLEGLALNNSDWPLQLPNDELKQHYRHAENHTDNRVRAVPGRLAFHQSARDTADEIVKKLKSIRKRALIANTTEVTIQVQDGPLMVTEDSSLEAFANPTIFEGIRNIIVRVAAKTYNEKDADAPKGLLINAHYDSVAYSPGASDNGWAVSACIELISVLAARAAPPARPIMFLFNEGEEMGLFGATTFVQTHPWSHTFRIFLNLDSGGGWGKLLLMQAGPKDAWLTDVYRDAVSESPYGGVLAADAFRSGVIPSGTDFSVLTDAGKAGVDMVYISNDFEYHTPLDSTAAYLKGSLQLAGEQVLELITALEGDSRVDEAQKGAVPVFYDVLSSSMASYSASTALVLGVVFFFFAAAIGVWHCVRNAPLRILAVISIAVVSTVVTMLFMVLFAALGALLLSVPGKMLFYSNVPLGVANAVVWSCLGAVAGSWILSRILRRLTAKSEPSPRQMEWFHVLGVGMTQALLLMVLASTQLGSAYFLFWYVVCFVAGFVWLGVLMRGIDARHACVEAAARRRAAAEEDGWSDADGGAGHGGRRSLSSSGSMASDASIGESLLLASSSKWRNATLSTLEPRAMSTYLWPSFYFVWTLFPSLLLISALYRALQYFVPVLGRLGVGFESVVPDVGFAVLFSALFALLLVPFLPMLHRLYVKSSGVLGNPYALSTAFWGGIALTLFFSGFGHKPYTAETPLRLSFIQHWNLVSNNSRILLATPAPVDPLSLVGRDTSAWKRCQGIGLNYLRMENLCLEDEQQVPPPQMAGFAAAPTVNVSNFARGASPWNATLSVRAPRAQVVLVRHDGWSMQAWAANGKGLAVPAHRTHYDDDQVFSIESRSRTGHLDLEMQFSDKQANVTFFVWISYLAETPLQRKLRENAPDWTQPWGKSNAVGPLLATSQINVTNDRYERVQEP